MYSVRDSAVKVVQPTQVRNHTVFSFSYRCRWMLIIELRLLRIFLTFPPNGRKHSEWSVLQLPYL